MSNSIFEWIVVVSAALFLLLIDCGMVGEGLIRSKEYSRVAERIVDHRRIRV